MASEMIFIGVIRMNKNKRVGEVNISNENYKMKIVEYNDTHNLLVEFQDEYKAIVHTNYQAFKKGEVKNPYHPSVYGVGYYGQGKYKSRENNRKTKIYGYWVNMFQRCYDPYFLDKHPTYRDCIVCNEWHCFQNFAKWYEDNYYAYNEEKMCLDKDILIKGNKVYSPETCIFVPERINSLFVKCDAKRDNLPIGCSHLKGVIRVDCQTLETPIYLGCFSIDRPFQAFTVYKNFKEKYIKEIADEYKDLIPKKLYDAMYKYEVEIND